MRWILALALLAAAGCSSRHDAATAASAPTNAPAAPSSMRMAIDGMTGKTAIEAGRRAQETVRRVSAEKNAELDQTMSDTP